MKKRERERERETAKKQGKLKKINKAVYKTMEN